MVAYLSESIVNLTFTLHDKLFIKQIVYEKSIGRLVSME
jgi:hypothetical protein